MRTKVKEQVSVKESSILCTMENSKEFVNNLDVIYAKPKVEILEILSKMDKNKLALLRIMLYVKLVDRYPEYEKYELPTLSNLESRMISMK